MQLLVLLVVVWWIANAITSIASKSEVKPSCHADVCDLVKTKWLELTTIQFFIGAFASAVGLKIMNGGPLPSSVNRSTLIVILGNLLGHLSVNISYYFISSGTTQVIKSSEPIFMFFVLLCFGNSEHKKQLNITIFFSLLLMLLGTGLFLLWDTTFNVWGVLAAVVSNTAFPVRNIALKKLDYCYNSALEKYFVLSFFALTFLAPALLIKMAASDDILFLSQSGLVAAIFHCVYNIASISVLKEISPMNHAILNFAKRVFVIVANIEYFNTILTWQMCLGLVIVLIGLALYHNKTNVKLSSLFHKKNISAILFGLVCLTGFFLRGIVGYVVTIHSGNISRMSEPHYSDRVITTSWLYHRPIPKEVIQNIRTIHNQNKECEIHVYCGSTHCTDTIKSMNNPRITSRFLVISDFLGHPALIEWLRHHPINKILAGVHFEDHLQAVVQLGHFWHLGGIFVTPRARVKADLFSNQLDEWVTFPPTAPPRIPNVLDVSKFSPGNPFINHLINVFTNEYSQKNAELPFQKILWDVYIKYCNTCKKCPVNSNLVVETTESLESDKKEGMAHFGVIGYHGLLEKRSYGNIGDQIQGIPGVQFLPFVDFFHDREKPIVQNSSSNHTVFFNAWWAERMSWPPARNIDPILLSIHLTPEFKQGLLKIKNISLDYLKRREPIGCRDTPTRQFLENQGVEAFFSACMTLLIQNPSGYGTKTENIYFVDVGGGFYKLMPESISKKAIQIGHSRSTKSYGKRRFELAFRLVKKYSRAKLVVTQRIHCALPCVAMGIPVIFINDRYLPGGDVKRVIGLTELFHTLTIQRDNLTDAKKWLHDFNWDNPPSNPNLGARMRHVATFWNVIRKRRALYESTKKFGMIPLTPRAIVRPGQLRFHLSFTNSFEPEIVKTLPWYQWRSVESIFRHHPNAKVAIYSNVFEQSLFNVLTEVGYYIEVKKYNIQNIANGTPFAVSTKKVDISILGDNIFRLLTLYKHGGVFLSTNAIVLKPLDNLDSNVIGANTENWPDLITFMKFEKNHQFLRSLLEKSFQKLKVGDKKFHLGTFWELLSNEAKENGVQITSTKIFQNENFEKDCFENTSGFAFKSQMELINNVIDVAQLPSSMPKKFEKRMEKLKNGTICKHLLNAHCVLCDSSY